ncbi:glycosyltransferase [bacterium]|nr:glycosyltransferase [bacterium]
MRLAFISTYPPQECGIANFTRDLVDAILSNSKDIDIFVFAPTDSYINLDFNYEKSFLIYPGRDNYIDIADTINSLEIDCISLQHEYGLFSGNDGDDILYLLDRLNVPVVTTLHTILTEPTESQKSILKEIGNLSEYLVVMTPSGIRLLRDIYRIDKGKIRFIYHGIPNLSPTLSKEEMKEKLGIPDDTFILSTFGLLSEGKGIEYVLWALPKVLEEFNVKYLIIGRTHPKVVRNEGEKYREKLLNIVSELGLEDNVIFVNRYLTQEEIINYLEMTDIYITPYLNPQQITSGTLSYAIGLGKVVISTPYIYAKDMLSNGRGFLCRFRDPDSIGDIILHILRNPDELDRTREKILNLREEMSWSNVGARYIKLFQEVTASELYMHKGLSRVVYYTS